MRFTVKKKELHNALKKMDRLAGSDGLAFCPVILSPGFEGLNLRRTSPTCQVTTELGVEIENPETIQLDFGNLLAAVGNLGDEIEILTESQTLFLVSGKSKARLQIARDADLLTPRPRPSDGAPSFMLPAQVLVDQIKRAIPAASTNEAESRLNGVAFHTTLGATRMVTADRRRAYLLKIHAGVENPIQTVVPLAMCNTVIAALGGNELVTTCQFGATSAVFSSAETEVIVAISENLPMDFEGNNIFSGKMDAEIYVQRAPFLLAVEQSTPFGSDGMHRIRVCFLNTEIEIIADNKTGASMEIKVEGKSSKEFEMCVNARYLSDFLKAIKGDDIKLQYQDIMSGLFSSEHGDLLAVLGITNTAAPGK